MFVCRVEAKRKEIDPEKVRLEPIVEVAVGWQREAVWDNVVCRHKNSIEVTTWTTRKKRQGTHVVCALSNLSGCTLASSQAICGRR